MSIGTKQIGIIVGLQLRKLHIIINQNVEIKDPIWINNTVLRLFSNSVNAIFIKQLMNMFRSLNVNTFVNTSNESIMLPNKGPKHFF